MLKERKHIRRAKIFAWGITGAVIFASMIALLNWATVKPFIKSNEEAFKLLGYVVGPALAYLGFIFGRLDKAELKDSSNQLGYARKAASDAKIEADNAKTDAASAEDRAKKEQAEAAHAQADALLAREAANSAAEIAATATAEAELKQKRIIELEAEFEKLSDTTQLWRLGQTSRRKSGFVDFNRWKDDRNGPRIVTIGLFKGGVGKTHIAANLAAYASIKQKKRVLLIDLDYQGSLSNLLLQAAEITEIEKPTSRIDAFFDPSANPRLIQQRAIRLEATNYGCKLGDQGGLPNVWLLPADYDLAGTESRLLIDRAIRNTNELDERFRLAHVLLHPDIRDHFDFIIIDTPPRMTLGTVNALVASHALIIPTILDQVSAEALRPFIKQAKELKNDLDLYNLEFAGIIGTMSRERNLSKAEKTARNTVINTSTEMLGKGLICYQHLPKRACITNSDDIGYFTKDGEGQLHQQFYDPIFDELWETIYHSTPPKPNRVRLFDI